MSLPKKVLHIFTTSIKSRKEFFESSNPAPFPTEVPFIIALILIMYIIK